MDSTHLTNSDKFSRMIYGADKNTYNHLLINYHFDITHFFIKAEMWGLPFYETFSMLYLNIYIRYLICYETCKLSFKIQTSLVMLLFYYANKVISFFCYIFIYFLYKLGEVIYVSVLF